MIKSSYPKSLLAGLLTLLIVFLGDYSAFGQENPRTSDQELWTGLSFKYKFKNKWKLNFEQQYRLNENASNLRQSFSEFTLSTKGKKFGDFELGHQLSFRYIANAASRDARRISFDTELEYDIPKCPIDIKYRLRLQDEMTIYEERRFNIIRNKVEFDMNASKRFDPFLSYEHFYLMQGFEARTHRYTGGVRIKISKDFSGKLFYRLDYGINQRINENQYVTGLAFGYDIN